MIYTTLNKIAEHDPCEDSWEKALRILGKTEADDEPIAMADILEQMGLDDALFCLRSLPEYDREWRLFAVWCVRQVEHLLTDQRSKDALDVAERYANGEATKDELLDARAAAGEAAGAAARRAAQAAAGVAAWEAAWEASREAAWEIQGAEIMRRDGKPFYFLPSFGFASPDDIPARPANYGPFTGE